MHDFIRELGAVDMPAFEGVRVLMMPILLEDLATVPFPQWRSPVRALAERANGSSGVAYLTIDEAHVKAGETHRRPGLHIDGHDGAGYGGPGPAPYAASGMVLLASHVGCVGYNQALPDEPCDEGDCEHMRAQLDPSATIHMQPGVAYWCHAKALHEAMPMTKNTRRQFVRLSMPNDGIWYDINTPSPYGIQPAGPIVRGGRKRFLEYRA